jgi:hypothetical protein
MRTKNKEEQISWADIRTASNHAPGLVYRVKAALPIIEKMRSRLSHNCYATSIYPQVVMVMLQLFTRSGVACWCPIVVGGYRNSGPLPSQLFDSNGYSYRSVAGVWREQLAFVELFDYIVSISNIPRIKKVAEHHRSKEYLSIFNRIEDAIASESRDGIFYFHLGAVFNTVRWPFRSAGYLFKYFVLRASVYFVLYRK